MDAISVGAPREDFTQCDNCKLRKPSLFRLFRLRSIRCELCEQCGNAVLIAAAATGVPVMAVVQYGT